MKRKIEQKINSRIKGLQEKVGATNIAAQLLPRGAITKDFMGSIAIFLKSEVDFLEKLIKDIEEECNEKEIIKEHGTVN